MCATLTYCHIKNKVNAHCSALCIVNLLIFGQCIKPLSTKYYGLLLTEDVGVLRENHRLGKLAIL